jgi:hypothetical protein
LEPQSKKRQEVLSRPPLPPTGAYRFAPDQFQKRKKKQKSSDGCRKRQQREATLLTNACRPAIAYSRVGTGRTPSAVPSSSNFPASHLGSKLGLIAQSYRVFSSPPFGQPTRLPGALLPPSPPAEKATAAHGQHTPCGGKRHAQLRLHRQTPLDEPPQPQPAYTPVN